jgi:uncharacterized damage-inducible protein DinB
LNWLRYLRGAVLRNVDGLDDERARWRPDERLLPLLGIIHHLTNVETRWIDGDFFNGSVDRADDEPLDVARLSLNACVHAYEERGAATERAVRTLSLDTPHPYVPDVNLRWVLLHLINETARHAGHADSVRDSSMAPSASRPQAGVMGASSRRSGTEISVAGRAHRGQRVFVSWVLGSGLTQMHGLTPGLSGLS